ncbi:hypothetical protein PR202_ga23744 [Eleusine coracana subsp. coracana]|uniref:HD domain-containing protein n=1 Tax=Eleusine coracana subsp. coracana TaxID=191504 RepID=A0AAV5D4Z6_ELECO|nr:hypothetical protein PR202_ga23744 [Eleusine coracana subsp. coracana]
MGSFSLLALQFVDTEEFQRLRDLKQLGLTYLVYPGAVHTRFEHSLGVYSLAGKVMDNLKMHQGEELGIDRVDIQTVKLAGLLHDIGHGPFSHLFEHEFLPRVIPGSTWSHEQMSVLLLDSIVDKHAIDIEADYLKTIKEMIIASSKFAATKSAKEKHFLYDIVANGRNGIDVDKFDYIGRDCRACGLGCNFQYWRYVSVLFLPVLNSSCFQRWIKDYSREACIQPNLHVSDVSFFTANHSVADDNIVIHKQLGKACRVNCKDNGEPIYLRNPQNVLTEGMRVMGDEICYPAKDYLSVHKLFTTRADLHRTVYTHAKVKAVELMLVDALVDANDYLGISLHANDPEDFWKLDDTIIKSIETAPNSGLKKSKEIIQRIRRRELYKFCNQYSVPRDKLEHFKDITAQDIVCSQKSSGVLLKEEDVAVSNVKIDLTRGKDNPLERFLIFESSSSLRIFFFFLSRQDWGCNEKFPITDDRVSHLLPAYNQDRIVRVYAKKPELVEAVSEAFENLQLRIYGEKTQVHDTPKKKRIRFN